MRIIEANIALAIHDLTVAYDTKPVLWDIDLEIPQGVLAAIVGPNGAGKSTLLKTILGFIKPVFGEVLFPALEKGKRGYPIAYVPQSNTVDWNFPTTVLDVVLMGRYGKLGWFHPPRQSDKEMAWCALEKMGIETLGKRQMNQLSGGQRQRVFLARAFVQEAELYLMDEPFKGVDMQTEEVLFAYMTELKQQGKTVIVVHHDLDSVATYFDWVTLVRKNMIANGKVGEVLTPENLALTYGDAKPSARDAKPSARDAKPSARDV